ncbi:hypothetical protein CerSpe_020830 [Prunus speciosa]
MGFQQQRLARAGGGVHEPGLARRWGEPEREPEGAVDASMTSAGRSGSTQTEMALSSRWKILNKELGKWRDALTKAMDNQRSGENLSDEIVQAQMWYGATGQGKKTFNHTQCWEVVKHCKRFSIIPTAPTVVLNETPLHDSQASDSPMESPMSEDSPIEREPRPIGRKAAKAKRGNNCTSNASKFLEEIVRQSALRIEIDRKAQEDDRAMQIEYAKEREYVHKEREYLRKENEDKKDRETWPWIQAICLLKQNNFGS